MELSFLSRFSKNTQMSSFKKICSSGNLVVPCRQPDRQKWQN